jgi:hypothetical protein
MQTIAPNTRNLETSISIFLGTDFAIVLIFYLAVFFVIGLGEIYLFEILIAEADRKASLLNAGSALSIVIGIIYSSIYRESLEGYDNGPKSYLNLLYDLKDFSSKFFTLCTPISSSKYNAIIIGQQQQSNQQFNQIQQQQQQQSKRVINEELDSVILDMKDSLLALTYYSFRLFDKTDRTDLNFELMTTRTRNIVENKRHNISNMLLILQNNIFLNLKYTEDIGLNNGSQIDKLSKSLSAVTETLKNINIGMHIKTPRVFQTHILFTLFVYFFVWVSFTLWLSIGFWPAAFVFPFVIFILTAPMIIRKWLGEAFDPNRKLKLMDYYKWRSDTSKVIVSDYEQCNSNIKTFESSSSLSMMQQQQFVNK